MNPTKVILAIAITLAITVTITYNTSLKPTQEHEGADNEPQFGTLSVPIVPKSRVSRFLAEEKKEKNPRAADHCNKDGSVCAYTNTTCCNNKCIDLYYDNQNCGACKLKCKFSQVCCWGKCVNLSYDKRHCGSCSNKCLTGQYCIYGMCDYA